MSESERTALASPPGLRDERTLMAIAALAVLFSFAYYFVIKQLYYNWTFPTSYYTHGFLIPIISGFLTWTKRDQLRALPIDPGLFGYPMLIVSGLMLLLGGYLGLTVVEQSSMVPLVAAIVMILFSTRHAVVLWFPIVYLLFMIPMPPSITSGAVVNIKLFATHQAVQLAQLCNLPMVQSGSYIVFGDDRLLVGEVCGGLRSLIALLAMGALMAYISKTAFWARWLILFVSGPIAIIANIVRIFALCVMGYFWGSEVVVGTLHDVSGILIFAFAFALLFSLEGFLRKVVPRNDPAEDAS